MSISWKISGEAGFGITTIGLAFSKLVARHSLNLTSFAEYPSLIRGGFTTFESTFSDNEVNATKKNIDILICLNQQGFDQGKKRLSNSSVLIYDDSIVIIDEHFAGLRIPVPFKSIRAKHKAVQVMVNTVALGISVAILGWEIGSFHDLIAKEFEKKGEEVVRFNQTLADEGYSFALNFLKNPQIKPHVSELINKNLPAIRSKKYLGNCDTPLVLTGNDAFALGSMVAGIGSYCAYPMSPSSTVLSTLALWAKSNKLVVRHTEDEIAAINEALGFSFVGVRSAVGTSGGGFALMVEGLSYAGIAELPVVVYLVQRPGPATGLPSWTGQGDLLFAAHGGHGEFMKVILAPGDLEESIELSSQSYNIADVFQTPVIVISDKHLGESFGTISQKYLNKHITTYKSDRGKITREAGGDYKRYEVTEDGVSPYLIPDAQTGLFWQANSYEHSEDSHTTEESQVTIAQVEKRARKIGTYLKSSYYRQPKVFGDLQTSMITFVSYGSNKGAILDAIVKLEKVDISCSYIHFTHIYPIDSSHIKKLFMSAQKLIFIENGSVGQLAKILTQEGCCPNITAQFLKYDGRQVFADEIVEFIDKLKKQNKI
jgi:2-oxoglutarate/2-oxoacid ferredoxin oxidoreductase subunit alpha